MKTKTNSSQSAASMHPEALIVALLPFLVKSNLAIAVMRGLLARGVPVAVASCSKDSGDYTSDPVEDFQSQGRLIDLSGMHPDHARDNLRQELAVRRTRLVFQVGAHALYPVLPYIKERNPGLKMVDGLYNEVGHSVNHFLYENCFDAVIVESDQMRQFVSRSTCKPIHQARIVENGVNLTYFRPTENAPAMTPLHVSFIGRMSAEKNPGAFIDIAERVGPQLGSVQFSLFGEGPLAGAIRQRVAQSPIKARLTYQGVAEDVRVALQTADVLMVPSKFDGRPNIIMEAAACGIPVIASPVGGIPELVDEGQNGVLLAPDQTDRITAFLHDLASDIGLRREWRAKCRAVAEARFDWNGMLDRYQATFLDIIKG